MLRAAAVAVLLLPLTGAGCVASAPEAQPAQEMSTVTDGTARLAVGEQASMNGHTVRFAEVVEDSRCPRGAQCITAGVARIRVEVDRQSVVLTVPGGRMADGDRSSADVGGLTVGVTDLEPYPEQDRSDAPAPIAVLTLS